MGGTLRSTIRWLGSPLVAPCTLTVDPDDRTVKVDPVKGLPFFLKLEDLIELVDAADALSIPPKISDERGWDVFYEVIVRKGKTSVTDLRTKSMEEAAERYRKLVSEGKKVRVVCERRSIKLVDETPGFMELDEEA